MTWLIPNFFKLKSKKVCPKFTKFLKLLEIVPPLKSFFYQVVKLPRLPAQNNSKLRLNIADPFKSQVVYR